MSERARNKIKALTALLFLLALVSLPLVGIFYAADREREERAYVLANGEVGFAKVVRSFKGRACAFRYQFELAGVRYEGGDGGCPLVRDYPEGAMVEIRYLSTDPSRSIAIGSNLWPGWAIVPFLLALPILFLAGVIAFSIVTGNGRSARATRRKSFLES